ncbi:serine/threonine protein kinase [Glycomyces artemisiae]|uniref:non-specific serine/threonine protein kinase n=2 Tax=Glycomyces artemisiae TaxID=1076443 RepID=A0A2T0UTC4_9ACTN|nr:serine/threonine protein kinase [Glycomyces artemisiae]
MDTMSSYGAPTAPLSPPRARPEADPESLLHGIERLTGFTEIDRGAYSTVYSATRFDDGAEVAVKIEARPLTDDASRERFRHEVQTAGRLSDHPCVVKMLSAGLTHQANPYVVMERCRGSVADLLDRHTTIPPHRTIEIGIRIADALAAAHEAGIVHRDIKPANLLIDHHGHAVLADFGLSSLIPTPRPGERFSMMATPAYAPLEVFQMQHVGPSADVYSLAATLYAMLSGNPPRFPAEGGLDINEVAALFDQPIPAIPGISPLLLEMLRTALINNPDGRPTAVEFREFLASIPEASTGIIPRVTDDLPHAPSPASQGLYGAYTSPPLNAAPTEFHEPAAPGYAELGGLPDSPSTLRLAPAKRRGPAAEEPPAPATAPMRRAAAPAAGPARMPSPPVSPPVSPAPAPVPPADFAGETGRWEAFSGGRDDDHDSRLPVPVPRNETGLTRRERRLKEGGGGSEIGRLIGMGAVGLVILGLLIAGGVWLFGGGEEPADLASQSMADDYVGECTLTVEGAGCVAEPACFDAAFAATGCEGNHLWEAYATGQLPEGVADVEAARADPTVAAACVNGQADGGPLSQLVSSDAVDWTTDVYVPGDGTFLCVAQLSDGTEASGSTFARAG